MMRRADPHDSKILVLVYSCPADRRSEEILSQSRWYKVASAQANVTILTVYAEPLEESYRLEDGALTVNAEERYELLSDKTLQMIRAVLDAEISFDYLVKLDATLVDYRCDHLCGEIAKELTFSRFDELFWSDSFLGEYSGICWLPPRPDSAVDEWAEVKGISVTPRTVFPSGRLPGYFQGKCYVLSREACEFIGGHGEAMSAVHCAHLGGSEDMFVGRMVQRMRAERDAPHDAELTFFYNTRHDCPLLRRSLAALRRSYPDARVLIRSDGDPSPEIAQIGERYAATVFYGERLFSIDRGGLIVDEMLRLFLEAPTRWLFKLDPDTLVHRGFHDLPEGMCVFGTVQQQGGLYSIQGGCIGFTVSAARELYTSGRLRDPELAQVPPPWAFNAALRRRPVERGLTSVDWTLGWAVRQLCIPLLDWPEILSEWVLTPENIDGEYAVTHPHKLHPPEGSAVTCALRVVHPGWLIPCVESGVMQAPVNTPLEVEEELAEVRRPYKIAAMRDRREKMCVVIPAYNAADWVERNLGSLITQRFVDWRAVYIDDCSQDQTAAIAERVVKRAGRASQVKIIRTPHRSGQAHARRLAYMAADPEEIVCMLDGDDWLADTEALTHVARAYSNGETECTFGRYRASCGGGEPLAWSGPEADFDPTILDLEGYRGHPWISTHLRTGRARHFQSIPIADLRDDEGRWLRCSTDRAEMLWALEQVEGRHQLLEEVVYIYNRVNSLRYITSWYRRDESPTMAAYRARVDQMLCRRGPLLSLCVAARSSEASRLRDLLADLRRKVMPLAGRVEIVVLLFTALPSDQVSGEAVLTSAVRENDGVRGFVTSHPWTSPDVYDQACALGAGQLLLPLTLADRPSTHEIRTLLSSSPTSAEHVIERAPQSPPLLALDRWSFHARGSTAPGPRPKDRLEKLFRTVEPWATPIRECRDDDELRGRSGRATTPFVDKCR